MSFVKRMLCCLLFTQQEPNEPITPNVSLCDVPCDIISNHVLSYLNSNDLIALKSTSNNMEQLISPLICDTIPEYIIQIKRNFSLIGLQRIYGLILPKMFSLQSMKLKLVEISDTFLYLGKSAFDDIFLIVQVGRLLSNEIDTNEFIVGDTDLIDRSMSIYPTIYGYLSDTIRDIIPLKRWFKHNCKEYNDYQLKLTHVRQIFPESSVDEIIYIMSHKYMMRYRFLMMINQNDNIESMILQYNVLWEDTILLLQSQAQNNSDYIENAVYLKVHEYFKRYFNDAFKEYDTSTKLNLMPHANILESIAMVHLLLRKPYKLNQTDWNVILEITNKIKAACELRTLLFKTIKPHEICFKIIYDLNHKLHRNVFIHI